MWLLVNDEIIMIDKKPHQQNYRRSKEECEKVTDAAKVYIKSYYNLTYLMHTIKLFYLI